MNVIKIEREEAINKIKNAKGIFSVLFIKKDGSERLLVGRRGVTKGVNGIGLSYDPEEKRLIVVCDMIQGNHKEGDKHFRMINMDTIKKFVINKVNYEVK